VKATAIVLAGSRPGRDPLAERFGIEIKALIPVGGEPMVRRPVKALLASDRIGDVIVVAQDVEALGSELPKDKRLTFRESGGTIAATIEMLCFDRDLAWPLLVTTADHALLDEQMIREFLDGAAGADVAIAVVERENLQKRLPQSKRTWLKFRGGAFTGANLFALSSPKVLPAIELWRSVEQDRKKSWRLIALAGPGVMLGAALRLLTIEKVLERLGAKLRLTIRPVRMSNSLAGVDVDKPEDHALVEAILSGRA
jgi:GTP:adenosylcobinamide-phosphate guanylyltransferase